MFTRRILPQRTGDSGRGAPRTQFVSGASTLLPQLRWVWQDACWHGPTAELLRGN